MAVDTPARIAILGGGPMGIEAGLYARYLGYEIQIFERGEVAQYVLQRETERTFSPFRSHCSSLGLAALAAQDPDFVPPDSDAALTGREWVDRYLVPLSQTDLISDHIQTNAQVVAVARSRCADGETSDEANQHAPPFRILVKNRSGDNSEMRADVVVDATGETGEFDQLALNVGDRPCDPSSGLTPEPDFYCLGAKSLAGNTDFRFAVGLQQIRSLFAIIGGREDLDLYESVKGLLP